MLVEPPESAPLPPGEPSAVTPFDASAPPALPTRGPVTALRVVGRNVQLDLSPAQERFTLGGAASPAVDLTLDGEQVSRLHLVLVRKGPKLNVLDQRSTNGTFYKGHRDPDFEIAPGDVFEVTRRIRLIALDPHLVILRQRLLWVLGLRNHTAADAAIEAIAANKPLLLVGPPGCEQRAIAEEIHRRSPFCDRDFVGAPVRFESRDEQDLILARGTRGTIFLDLARAEAPLPNHFVTGAFADSRPIVAAPSEERTTELLDHFARRLHVVPLATPADRPDDIPRLLDALIVQEHQRRLRELKEGAPPLGELLSITALGETNLDALKRHPWPGHFADLRRHVPRFHALLTSGLRLRATARALGLKSVSSVIEALDRIGVHVKSSDGDDTPIEGGADDELPTPPGTPTR